MALDARKFDVSENYNHNRTNRTKQHMRENLTGRIFLIGLDARKFSCVKISTFTVIGFFENFPLSAHSKVQAGHINALNYLNDPFLFFLFFSKKTYNPP